MIENVDRSYTVRTIEVWSEVFSDEMINNWEILQKSDSHANIFL